MYNTKSDNDLVDCPYNNTHRILRKRLQTHLFRCSKQHPDVELRKCPFNITHLLTELQYTRHLLECPDRKIITQYKYKGADNDEEEIKIRPNLESEENWDDSEAPDFRLKTLTKSTKTKVDLDKITKRTEDPQSSRRATQSKQNRSRSRSPLGRKSKAIKYELDDDTYYNGNRNRDY